MIKNSKMVCVATDNSSRLVENAEEISKVRCEWDSNSPTLIDLVMTSWSLDFVEHD